MLPADDLQRAETVGDKNGLVSNVAEIAWADAREKFERLLVIQRSRHSCGGGISRTFIPCVHRPDELLRRVFLRGHTLLIDGVHSPAVAFALVHRLRALEVIEGPEDRQP